MRLGDILVAQGAITRTELEDVIPQLKDRLGTALRAHTLIRSRSLAQAIAEQQQLTYIALNEIPCTLNLFIPRNLSHYIRHSYLPYCQLPDRLQIVTPDPSPTLRKNLEIYYQQPIELLVISQRDFTHALSTQAAATLTRTATLALRRSYKFLTADRVLTTAQRYWLLAIVAILSAAFLLAPTVSWPIAIITVNVFYLITLAFKMQLLISGSAECKSIVAESKSIETRIQSADTNWPTYTILVPLYQESFPVLSRLISHLHALDYPREKLDIKLICEADDTETIAAVKRCKPPETMEILTVAPSYPRTKPKACNVALPQIRGEYLVIFDAEDAPEPTQLKRAVTTFNNLPLEVACLQTPLNYYNRSENLLTKLFSIEYSALFRLTLPALQRLNLPIPLGGTSNHMRVAALQKTGGWDAFNVTEDADLGMRLAYFGYRTRLLPSLTLEESPITLTPWLKQRSRWIKGYIQTWLVYMRAPAELKRRLGTRAFCGFQLFIGAPTLTFFIAPFFWAVYLATLTGLPPMHLSPPILWLCSISLIGGILVQWLYAATVIRLENWRGMRFALTTYPIYWLLHSIASFRAIWQLAFMPHAWEKTRHGVSHIFG